MPNWPAADVRPGLLTQDIQQLCPSMDYTSFPSSALWPPFRKNLSGSVGWNGCKVRYSLSQADLSGRQGTRPCDEDVGIFLLKSESLHHDNSPITGQNPAIWLQVVPGE